MEFQSGAFSFAKLRKVWEGKHFGARTSNELRFWAKRVVCVLSESDKHYFVNTARQLNHFVAFRLPVGVAVAES
jgi:hypothetical protein